MLNRFFERLLATGHPVLAHLIFQAAIWIASILIVIIFT